LTSVLRGKGIARVAAEGWARNSGGRFSRHGLPFMYLYLPVAELSVNALLILGLSAAVGFLSGLVGVGGGFIMTPLLILVGIPPPVAVATELSQVSASSASGMLAYWRRKLIDLRMGLILVGGGVVGSWAGVWLFAVLETLGQIDVLISLSYVFLLSVIGALMLAESVTALRRRAAARTAGQRATTAPASARAPPENRPWWPALLVGASVGVLSGGLGIGGGFILVPAMIYVLRMPTSVVIGTSFLYILIVSSLSTYLHASSNRSVDLLLALLLVVGGVAGAQAGVRAGVNLPAEMLRAILAAVVLGSGLLLLWELVATPAELFSLTLGRGA